MKHFICGLVLSAFALFPSTKCWVNRNATVENVFEGDIVLNPAHRRRILKIKENSNIQSFPTATTKDELWENGQVPYKIEISDDGFTALEIKLIENIMLEFQFLTCIKFFRRNNESNYLHIVHDAFECKSFIGYQGRVQRLWLTKDCINRNTVLHELMHAIGFWHEQSRYDRDDYVEILEHNIEEGKESEFLKYRSSNITHPKTDYDYNSVMHYGTHDFSKNGLPTIRAKKPGAEIKRDGLSKIDKEEINRFYRCSIVEENCSKKQDEIQKTTLIPSKKTVGALSSADIAATTTRYGEREQLATLLDCPQTVTSYYAGRQRTFPVCAIAHSESNCGGDKLYIAIWYGNLDQVGWLNKISSAEINPGCKLKLCTETSYTGSCILEEGGETGKNVRTLQYRYNNGIASLSCTCGEKSDVDVGSNPLRQLARGKTPPIIIPTLNIRTCAVLVEHFSVNGVFNWFGEGYLSTIPSNFGKPTAYTYAVTRPGCILKVCSGPSLAGKCETLGPHTYDIYDFLVVSSLICFC